MTLTDFLTSLLRADFIAAAVGVVLSFVLEMWPAFGQLEPRAKRLVVMALCFLFPLGATVGLYGGALTADQVWVALMAGFVAFWGSQVGHATRLSAK
jgi:hypothetical protein